jgi:hypothetical protein
MIKPQTKELVVLAIEKGTTGLIFISCDLTSPHRLVTIDKPYVW